MASHCRLRFHYFGSLVSLGELSAVGSLMGRLLGGSLLIQGLIARNGAALYKMHQVSIHGMVRVVSIPLAGSCAAPEATCEAALVAAGSWSGAGTGRPMLLRGGHGLTVVAAYSRKFGDRRAAWTNDVADGIRVKVWDWPVRVVHG